MKVPYLNWNEAAILNTTTIHFSLQPFCKNLNFSIYLQHSLKFLSFLQEHNFYCCLLLFLCRGRILPIWNHSSIVQLGPDVRHGTSGKGTSKDDHPISPLWSHIHFLQVSCCRCFTHHTSGTPVLRFVKDEEASRSKPEPNREAEPDLERNLVTTTPARRQHNMLLP